MNIRVNDIEKFDNIFGYILLEITVIAEQSALARALRARPIFWAIQKEQIAFYSSRIKPFKIRVLPSVVNSKIIFYFSRMTKNFDKFEC